jgi:AcrR family transcriptional regulator
MADDEAQRRTSPADEHDETHLLPPKPRTRTRQTRAAVTIDAVVDAAIELIERDGADQLTIAAITARTGVSHGAIYHHFGDRDGVVRAAQFARLARQPGEDIAALGFGVDASESVEQFRGVVRMMAERLTTADRDPVRLTRAAVLTAAERDPELFRAIHDLESGVAAELVEVLGRARERGLLDPSLDVRAIAAVLEAISFGLVLLRYVEPAPTPDALADTLERVFASMLRASG